MILQKWIYIVLIILILIGLSLGFKSLPLSNYARVYYRLGFENDKEGNFTQALKYYKKSTYHDPYFAPSYLNMGNIHKKLNNQPEMIRSYENISNLNVYDRRYLNAYLELGKYYYETGQTYIAIQTLRKAVSVQDIHKESFFYLGLCYHKLGDQDKLLKITKHLHNIPDRKYRNQLIKLLKDDYKEIFDEHEKH